MTLANGTPAWAVSDQTTCIANLCTAPPDSLQDWKAFLTALMQHYNGTVLPNIRYYELWNEANTPASWTGTNRANGRSGAGGLHDHSSGIAIPLCLRLLPWGRRLHRRRG